MSNNDGWGEEIQGSLDAELWDPSEGDHKAGAYERVEMVEVPDTYADHPGATRKAPIYYFKNLSGEGFWKMWGSVDLNTKLTQLAQGDLVRITFTETTRDGAKSTKRFRVERRAPNAPPPQEATATGAATADDDIPF